MTGLLHLIPLGGLGEVGMNCMAVEQDGAILVLDCGVTFPHAPKLGVDVIHADLSYLRERASQIVGIVLTHAHEDHLGAVPYLLAEVHAPVYAPPYALALLKERLAERRMEPPPLHTLVARHEAQVGPFGVEPIGVTHSTPHSMALALRTRIGLVVHSGDFRIDPHPMDGSYFDAERLRALGDAGVRLLLSDSTNADVEGTSGSEQRVAEGLLRRIQQIEERAIVSTFASHIERLGIVLEAAAETGRSVVLLGRSMLTHHRIARDLGLLPPRLPLPVSPSDGMALPRNRVLVLATGSQGEPNAALMRLADRGHRDFQIEAGDEVVLSSRIIPGNDRAVFTLIDNLERSGIRVWHRGAQPDLHVSGHACRQEQRDLIALLRPQAFMPVHGAYRQLRRHASLAEEAGVKEVLVVENGACVEVGESGPLQVVRQVAHGRVHRAYGQVLDRDLLRERSLIGEGGHATVVLTIDLRGGLVAAPEVATCGMLPADDRDALTIEASHYVAQALAEIRRGPDMPDVPALREQAQRALRRFLNKRLGYRPLTQAIVTQVEV